MTEIQSLDRVVDDLHSVLDSMEASDVLSKAKLMDEQFSSATPRSVVAVGEHASTAVRGLGRVFVQPLVDEIEAPSRWSIVPLDEPSDGIENAAAQPVVKVETPWLNEADVVVEVIGDLDRSFDLKAELGPAVAALVVFVRADGAISATEKRMVEHAQAKRVSCAVAVSGLERLDPADREGVLTRLHKLGGRPAGGQPAPRLLQLGDKGEGSQEFAAFVVESVSEARSPDALATRRGVVARRVLDAARTFLTSLEGRAERHGSADSESSNVRERKAVDTDVIDELRSRRTSSNQRARDIIELERERGEDRIRSAASSVGDLGSWWDGKEPHQLIEEQLRTLSERLEGDLAETFGDDARWLGQHYHDDVEAPGASHLSSSSTLADTEWSRSPRLAQAAVGGVLLTTGLLTGAIVPFAAIAGLSALGLEARHRTAAGAEREEAIRILTGAYDKGCSDLSAAAIDASDEWYKRLRERHLEFLVSSTVEVDPSPDVPDPGLDIDNHRIALDKIEMRLDQILNDLTGARAQ